MYGTISRGNKIYTRSTHLYNERQKIVSLLKERQINYLIHFTPRENVASIRHKGLVLRNHIPNATVTDTNRYDSAKNAICLSISEPNRSMLKCKEEQGFDLVMLVLDAPKILAKKNCTFYQHNAASSEYHFHSLEQHQSAQALQAMFDNYFEVELSTGIKHFSRNHQLASFITTSNQAEVQCFDTIEPECIVYIFEKDIPRDYKDIESAIEKLTLQSLKEHDKKNDTRGAQPTLEDNVAKEHNDEGGIFQWIGSNIDYYYKSFTEWLWKK